MYLKVKIWSESDWKHPRIPLTPLSLKHTEREEEQWFAQTAVRSCSKEEISFTSVRVSHTRAARPVRRPLVLLRAGCHGFRAEVSRRSRSGRVVSHRERDAGRYGHGASAQKVRLAGSELLCVSTSTPALLVLPARHQTWTQTVIQREVRRLASSSHLYLSDTVTVRMVLLSSVRYRVVVPYPPQSEAEIELKEGDIVFVHKKREDGWYKGTLQRTGRTGLFPGSFVEIF